MLESFIEMPKFAEFSANTENLFCLNLPGYPYRDLLVLRNGARVALHAISSRRRGQIARIARIVDCIESEIDRRVKAAVTANTVTR